MLGNEVYAMSATPHESQIGTLIKMERSQIAMKIGRKVFTLLMYFTQSVVKHNIKGNPLTHIEFQQEGKPTEPPVPY